MSFFKTQATGIIGNLIGQFLAIKPSRSFASFSGFCSVTEAHTSSVTATQYPIEDGTQGTDHIVKEPQTLEWDLAFSEDSNPQQMYEQLQNLLWSGIPFEATTGLKTYDSLILTNLSVSQDYHNGRILRIQCSMQEIIITTPMVTTLPASDRQANAKNTASTANSGTKQVTDAKPTQKTGLQSIADKISGK